MKNRQSYESQVEYITRILKNDIVLLKLKPGESLSQNSVRVAFDCSRSPVREAFIRLEKEYLVEVLPQKSTKVTLINTKKIEDFLFMRSGIEAKVLGLLDDTFPTHCISLMEKNLTQQELVLKQNPHDFIVLDNEFHSLIYQGLGKQNVWEFLKLQQTQYDRLRNLFFQKNAPFHVTIEHHHVLLDIIKNSQTKQAVEFVDIHIGKIFSIFDTILDEYSHYMQ